MGKMSHRERVKRAVEGDEVDRIPLDLGATTTTGIHYYAVEQLYKYLGIDREESDIVSIYLQNACINENLKRKLHIDTGFLQLHPSRKIRFEGENFWDEWGIKYKKVILPNNITAFELNDCPLKDASIEDLEKYNWPDAEEQGRDEKLKSISEDLYTNTDYWIGCTIGTISGIFELAHHLRGIDNFLVDLMINKDFSHRLLEIITEIQIKKYDILLNAVGDHVDMAFYGDDLATQNSSMISVELYREMIKPYQRKLINFIKSKNNKIKMFYHCCGSIVNLLDDFIEIGVDIINPVQITAAGMEPAMLNEKYGDKICFWGGVDTQKLLRKGSVEDVREKVRELINAFDGTGFVVSAVHNILQDVPPENIYAMFDEAYNYKL